MKELLADIVAEVKANGELTSRKLDRIIAAHNRRFREPTKHFAKKQLASAYAHIKQEKPQVWASWDLGEAEERTLLAAIQMKPRRTASGVATITVITKPHPCAGNCIYCPNDCRMPKSYLHAEPACQRAERNNFDPYLQVASRLSALERMGHATDKIELIVLGGSFTDYPRSYQMWFMRELFAALNDAGKGFEGVVDVFAAETDADGSLASPAFPASALAQGIAKRLAAYEAAGIARDESILAAQVEALQQRVNTREVSYNEAVVQLYGPGSAWETLAKTQTGTLEDVQAVQVANENAAHRVVGLVVETRPDAITPDALTLLRQLGCTKLQMGVQTLDEVVAQTCQRPTTPERIREAFELVRAFGYKSHAHFMANLPGATAQSDIADYAHFVTDTAIAPDEVKLYPCALIAGTGLQTLHEQGAWQPYEEHTLVEVLAADVLATPAHTRISRMIRDFSSTDIVAGNKKPNLRQMVEQQVAQRVAQGAAPVQEIRMREIATEATNASALELLEETYETTNSTEVFLQYILPAAANAPTANKIAGFLRLSLPRANWVEARAHELPVAPGEAMIREVHVYGAAARLHAPTSGAQHQGLGRALVERACEIAHNAGYTKINVISAIGTRNYYRNLDFADHGLYLQREL